MVQNKTPRSRKFFNYALAGTLVITSLGISGKLFVKLITHTDAQENQIKDQSVITEDVAEAPPAAAALEPLQTAPVEKNIITTYQVKSGDTLSTIAESFDVSINTVRWANDLTTKSTIKVGDELVILPFSGIQYKVKKGDTLSAITVKYGGDEKEIMQMNGLESEKDIQPGDTLLIPDGEMPVVVPPKPVPKPVEKKIIPSTKSDVAPTAKTTSETTNTTSSSGTKFINPIPGSLLTQGLHDGHAAVDFGAPIGTTVRAAAGGTVIIAKSGYNGGYGTYIVITHTDGTQTLYGHLSKLEVSAGATVTQGQEIAKSGNTGKSTGAHLHFKVTGTTNPFGDDVKGTHY